MQVDRPLYRSFFGVLWENEKRKIAQNRKMKLCKNDKSGESEKRNSAFDKSKCGEKGNFEKDI